MSMFDQVTDLLSLTDEGIARSQRRLLQSRTFRYVCFSLMALSCTIAGAALLCQTWQSGGYWLQFWASFMSLAQLCSWSLKLVFARDAQASLYAPVRVLHAAAVAGDDRLAPPAVQQLAPWGTGDTGDAVGPLPGDVAGSFRRIRSRTVSWAFVAVLAAATFGLFVGVGVLVASAGGALYAAGWIVLAASLALLAASAARGLWLRRRLRVHVDERGLWWHAASGRRLRLDWQQARVFFRARAHEGFGRTGKVMYSLDGGGVALAWRAKGISELAASERLVGLITARTRLPLRDVSLEARRIALAAEAPVPRLKRRQRTEASPLGVAGGANDLRTPRWAWLVPLVLLSSFVVTALSAPVVQPRYYGALYAQARAHAPLYTDSLTRANSEWPTRPPEVTFSGAGYEIQPSFDIQPGSWPLVPHRRDNVLIEVTGRTGRRDDLGGVGFIVWNPRDPSDALSFNVTPSGDYWLDRYGAQYSDGYKVVTIEHDDAIRTGFNTPNRIAVLVRGSQYSFYVNGQFAANYTDDALRGGPVALYVDLTSQGTFQDFAMYPIG